MLTAFLLRSNHDTRRQVPETNGAFRFVYVLSARSTRTKRLDFTLAQKLFV
jgi:hypothetical protein